jgi:hypothetical protein
MRQQRNLVLVDGSELGRSSYFILWQETSKRVRDAAAERFSPPES